MVSREPDLHRGEIFGFGVEFNNEGTKMVDRKVDVCKHASLCAAATQWCLCVEAERGNAASRTSSFCLMPLIKLVLSVQMNSSGTRTDPHHIVPSDHFPLYQKPGGCKVFLLYVTLII